MKHPLLIAFFLTLFAFLALSATAQEKATALALPDSLVGKLKENRGTDLNRVKALDDAIMFFFDEHEISDAAGYINELNEIANDLHDNFWMAKSQYYLALCDYEKYDNGGFFTHINEALKIAETLRESSETQLLLTRIYLVKSAVFFNNNLLPECQKSIEQGLKIAEKNGFEKQEHELLLNYGSLLIKLEDYNKAIDVFKSIKSDKSDLHPLLNIASTNVRLQQYDSVFLYANSIIHNISKSCETESNKLNFLINAFHIKAVGYIAVGNWNDAIQCLDSASIYIEQYNDKSLISTNYLHRAEALNGMQEFEIALDCIGKSIDIAKEIELIEAEWYAVEVKSDILENMGEYQKEVQNLRYFNALTDTINNRENVELVQMQKFQKETLALEQQFEQQQAAMKQRHRFFVLLLISFLIVGALVVAIFSLNRKRKLETTAAVLDTRNREVTTKTMEQMHLNQVLEEVVTKLTHFVHNPKDNANSVESAIRDLKSLITDGSVKDFDYFFTQVQPNFYKKLQADFPELTPNDLRLCAFIKGNLNVKEVAELTGISADSVKAARSRLRKKLGITNPNASLSKFLGKY